MVATLEGVFLVEDDARVRASLVRALTRASVPVVAACEGASEARLGLKTTQRWNVALIDLGLPDGEGISLIRDVRSARPASVPLVFSVFEDPRVIVEAIAAGAEGYLLKSTPIEKLVGLLGAAATGSVPLSPSVARHLLASFRSPPALPEPPLSPREREVLELLCSGRTYKEVAALLQVSPGTVQSHMKSVYSKLQVTSKAELTDLAHRKGFAR